MRRGGEGRKGGWWGWWGEGGGKRRSGRRGTRKKKGDDNEELTRTTTTVFVYTHTHLDTHTSTHTHTHTHTLYCFCQVKGGIFDTQAGPWICFWTLYFFHYNTKPICILPRGLTHFFFSRVCKNIFFLRSGNTPWPVVAFSKHTGININLGIFNKVR